ncbi:hypothetical protein CHS0354_019230 [Potamilus streckersoni]|uniref:Uncharacterized protein n=1 Tax=Potamilus streckersoni TaxID=2493646 RepID=A0AAE0SZ81_9BIVA|nr:hypothetical protein CHS0354_019230 [Potamilus streckersoni]
MLTRICTDPKQHMEEVRAWSDMRKCLLEMIQTSASIVYEEGLINVVHHKRQARFFTSVLDSEITHALHLAPEGCLFVIRDIVGIEYEQNKAACYVDIMSNLSANESKLIKLRQMINKIDSACLSENKVLMKTTWKDGGIDLKKHSEHKEYLENFSALLSTKLRYMIECSLEKKQPTALPIKKRQLFLESLVNLHHCKMLYRKYPEIIFDEVVAKIQALLITGTRQDHQVILIKGQTGSGKSMVVSKICHRARELFGKDTILIPRFINILPKPPTGEHLFLNICEQINVVLQQNINIKNYDYKKLRNYFNGLLNRISKGNRHLLIVLCGINQLRETNSFDTAGLEWITNNLPPKIHIIATASTSDKKCSVLQQVEGKMKSTESVVHLEPLTENLCIEIIKSNLKQFKQRVTPEQEITLRRALVQSKHLLHVINVTQIARCWQSNFVPGNNDLPFSVLEFTKETLCSLERKYGDQIMGAFCRYICLSQCGLSEMEILDLLSCNNDILLTCFPVKLPSVLRFPHYIWSQLKHEIGILLVARYLHRKQLLSWSRACIAVIQERYLQEPGQVLTVHSDIAHLFLETWANSKSIVDTDRRIFVIENTNRFVYPQPLLYSEKRYNERRVYELWHQLMKSGDIDALKEHAVMNFEYMMATIDNQSLHDLIENLQTIMASHVDPEILLVANTLREVRMVLERSPMQLANELIGRLRELKEFFPNSIDCLVTQCMEWCDSYCLPILVPLTSWLTDSHTPFITSLTEFYNIACIVPHFNNQHVIVAQENVIIMYHLATKKPVKRFEGHSGKITCLTLTKATWLLGSGSEDCSVIIWHVKEGTPIKRIRKHASAVTSLAINPDDEICASGHNDGIVSVVEIKEGTVITKLSMHNCQIRGVLFNNNGSILLSGKSLSY